MASETGRGKAILVVDDEPLIADGLAKALRLDGHEVYTAANGAVALDKLQEGIYDLIVSDIKMPVLDGLSLYQELERRHPELRRRFIFLTGASMDVETTELLKETETPCLRKPFRFNDVRAAVQWTLRRA